MVDAEASRRGPNTSKALAEPVFCRRSSTGPSARSAPAEARRLSSDLRAAGSWGPMSKVGSVALAWRELAERLEEDGRPRSRSSNLKLIQFARRLWVLPPPGGLL